MTTTTLSMMSMKNVVDFETMLRHQCALMGDRSEGYRPSSASAAATSTSELLLDSSKMFTCKTCGRKFQSFQALGGHRASHKKMTTAQLGPSNQAQTSTAAHVAPSKPKNHACPICGIEFPIGQALGGHMRRHRGYMAKSNNSTLTTDNTAENSDGNDTNDNKKIIVIKRKIRDDDVAEEVEVKKKVKHGGVCLELSLSPGLETHAGGDVAKGDVRHDDDVEEGEIVEQAEEETLDLELKLASW